MMNNSIKNYDIIQPEVIVGLGEKTVGLDINNQNEISHLHLNIEDWLGDDLVEVFPCYLVTEFLKTELEKITFSGYEIKEIEVTKDEYFPNNYQLKKPLARFYWLYINGIKGITDLYIDEKLKLNASHDFLRFLKYNTFSTNYLDINPSRTETDDFLDDLFK